MRRGWSNLPNERVTSIANGHLNGGFENTFSAKFGSDVPETLNGDHRIVVVASEIDASSERIIKYLSETHGVNVNAATFQYFQLSEVNPRARTAVEFDPGISCLPICFPTQDDHRASCTLVALLAHA